MVNPAKARQNDSEKPDIQDYQERDTESPTHRQEPEIPKRRLEKQTKPERQTTVTRQITISRAVR